MCVEYTQIKAGQINPSECCKPFHISQKLFKLKRNDKTYKSHNKNRTMWNPGQSDMVCSFHFVDGKPSFDNPNPSLNRGYEKPSKRPRRNRARLDLELSRARTTSDTVVLCDHVYS